MAGGAAIPHRAAHDHRVNESLLRELVRAVIGVLVRCGAVQDALVRALATWPDDPPRDPKGWLVTVAWRRFLDQRAAAAYLHERAGDLELSAQLYAEAARAATNLPERGHLTRQAARVHELLRSSGSQ